MSEAGAMWDRYAQNIGRGMTAPAALKEAREYVPRPVQGQSPAIAQFLEPVAAAIADDTKTQGRHPLQHPDCPKVAGTLGCLEAGGGMCMECAWWESVAGEEED